MRKFSELSLYSLMSQGRSGPPWGLLSPAFLDGGVESFILRYKSRACLPYLFLAHPTQLQLALLTFPGISSVLWLSLLSTILKCALYPFPHRRSPLSQIANPCQTSPECSRERMAWFFFVFRILVSQPIHNPV